MRFVRTEAQQGLQTCKFCVKCSHWHPITEFYIDRAKADGLRAYCKTCDIEKSKQPIKRPASVPVCETCGQATACV